MPTHRWFDCPCVHAEKAVAPCADCWHFGGGRPCLHCGAPEEGTREHTVLMRRAARVPTERIKVSVGRKVVWQAEPPKSERLADKIVAAIKAALEDDHA